MGVSSQAHSLHRTIADAQEKLRRLELIPPKDDFAHGTVVRVEVDRRYGDPTRLTYVFMKVVTDEEVATPNGGTGRRVRWYHTGDLAYLRNKPLSRWVSWDVLVSWLIDHVELVSWHVMVLHGTEAANPPMPDQVAIYVEDGVSLPANTVVTVNRRQDGSYVL